MKEIIFVCEKCGLHYKNKKPEECDCGKKTFRPLFFTNFTRVETFDEKLDLCFERMLKIFLILLIPIMLLVIIYFLLLLITM